MNIPNLPTDSLYKFFALSGVTLVIVSCSALYIAVNSFSEKVTEVNGAQKLVELEIDWLDQDTKLLEREVSTMDSAQLNQPEEHNLTEYREQADQIITKQRALLYKHVQLETKLELVRTIGDNTRFTIRIFSTLAFIGLVMAYIGFYFWYHRVQKFLDQQIKQQVDQSSTPKSD